MVILWSHFTAITAIVQVHTRAYFTCATFFSLYDEDATIHPNRKKKHLPHWICQHILATFWPLNLVLLSTKGPQIAYERSFRWKLAHFRYLCQVGDFFLLLRHCFLLLVRHLSPVFACIHVLSRLSSVQCSPEPCEDHRLQTDVVWRLFPASKWVPRPLSCGSLK